MRVWPGQPYPLGATWTGSGVNFAIFSAHATRVVLCLFDSADAKRESACVPLLERLANYLGYNTLGFFAPDIRYAADGEPAASVAEFKRMVKALHSAGLEMNTLLILLNAHDGEVPFALPRVDGKPWTRVIDTIDTRGARA